MIPAPGSQLPPYGRRVLLLMVVTCRNMNHFGFDFVAVGSILNVLLFSADTDSPTGEFLILDLSLLFGKVRKSLKSIIQQPKMDAMNNATCRYPPCVKWATLLLHQGR